jgi:hypothetical protein
LRAHTAAGTARRAACRAHADEVQAPGVRPWRRAVMTRRARQVCCVASALAEAVLLAQARSRDVHTRAGASRRRVSVPSPRRARCAAANSLFAREVEGAGALPRASALQRSLGSAALAAQLDVASGSAAAEHAQLSFLRRRSRIVELVACSDGQGGGVVVGLAHNGRCVAFCRGTSRSASVLVRATKHQRLHNADSRDAPQTRTRAWAA